MGGEKRTKQKKTDRQTDDPTDEQKLHVSAYYALLPLLLLLLLLLGRREPTSPAVVAPAAIPLPLLLPPPPPPLAPPNSHNPCICLLACFFCNLRSHRRHNRSKHTITITITPNPTTRTSSLLPRTAHNTRIRLPDSIAACTAKSTSARTQITPCLRPLPRPPSALGLLESPSWHYSRFLPLSPVRVFRIRSVWS